MIVHKAIKLLLTCLAFACAYSPLLAQDHEGHRVIVVGDLHGDYAAYRDILAAAGLSDREGHWRGGSATLVQMGDIVDRGPDSLAIIADLRELARRAPRQGGQVIVLIGNHEAMNAIGDLRYVDPGEYAAFVDGVSPERRERVYEANRAVIEQFFAAAEPPLDAAQAREAWMGDYPLGKVEHRLAWSQRGEIRAWVGQLPAVVLIGETLFVHGGLSAEYAVHSLAELNQIIQDGIRSTGETQHSPVLDDPLGPLWYRGNIFRDEHGAAALGLAVEGTDSLDQNLCESSCHPPGPGDLPVALRSDQGCARLANDPTGEGEDCQPTRPSIEEELDLVLAAYGARRMIVAHTPSLEGIVSRPDGRLIRADTGISSHYGGPHSYLEIHHGHTDAWERRSGAEWQRNRLPEPEAREIAVP
jgi:Calcineurin-like phosphoesterase